MQISLCTQFYALWILRCFSMVGRNRHNSKNCEYWALVLLGGISIASTSFFTRISWSIFNWLFKGKSLQTSPAIFPCSPRLSHIFCINGLILLCPWILSSVSSIHEVHWALCWFPLPTPRLGNSLKEVSWNNIRNHLVYFMSFRAILLFCLFFKVLQRVVSYILFILGLLQMQPNFFPFITTFTKLPFLSPLCTYQFYSHRKPFKPADLFIPLLGILWPRSLQADGFSLFRSYL